MTGIPIRFMLPSGEERTVLADAGTNVMRAALNEGLSGLVAECGGECACATCHIYVDPAYLDRLPTPDRTEDEMLDGVASERMSNSRLSCQVMIDSNLAGMAVTLPPTQY